MILIVGGDSLIGTALKRLCAERGLSFLATSRRPTGLDLFLDLADDPQTWNLPETIDSAILCAAVTNVAKCEKNPAETRFVNVHQTMALAHRLRDLGVFIVFLSTDLVFSPGETPAAEDTPPDPVTQYGRQKAEVERSLVSLTANAAVVRLGKVVSPELPLFREWARALRAQESIHPYSDVSICPVTSAFVAEEIIEITASHSSGIHHVAGNGQITYAEVASLICREIGAHENLCVPVATPSTVPRSRLLSNQGTGLGRHRTPPTAEKTIKDLAQNI